MKEFEKVIGYDGVKNELYKICDMMQNAGIYKKLGVQLPKGILLYGRPGVGKTLMANCFIEASGRNCFVIRKDKGSGEFIEYMRNVFNEAIERNPSIILLDDMDKFANDDEAHKNSEEFVTLQTCIDKVKNEDVFIIATANDLENLPASLLRAGRFDNRLLLPTPEGDDAVKIIKSYVDKKDFVEDIDTSTIARLLNGSSCAELESIINEAGIIAGYKRKEKIDEDDLIDACIRNIYKSPLTNEIVNQSVKEHIICHEAGHALVSEVLEKNSVLFISVRQNKSDKGGFTMRDRKDNYSVDIEQMKTSICVALGGKAATEIVYGKADTGVEYDLRHAFNILENFVKKYGAYGFKGYEISRHLSEENTSYVENKLYSEMENFYQKTKKIIIDNREFLNKLMDALRQKDILTAKEIQKIEAKCIMI